MSDTVTIPADVAKRYASQLRGILDYDAVEPGGLTRFQRDDLVSVADLLDPKPQTLREQVAEVFLTLGRRAEPTPRHEVADAVLAVVRDAVAALPCFGGPSSSDDVGPTTAVGYRAAVLRLLDGAER
jgi:hypothetical protein